MYKAFVCKKKKMSGIVIIKVISWNMKKTKLK